MRISDWSSDVCSSDLLVGGIVGAGVAHAGFEGIQWTGLNKTVIAIFLSPMLGMLLAMLVMLLSSWALRRATAKFAESTFRTLHLFSSAAYSLSHGLNDAQKLGSASCRERVCQSV